MRSTSAEVVGAAQGVQAYAVAIGDFAEEVEEVQRVVGLADARGGDFGKTHPAKRISHRLALRVENTWLQTDQDADYRPFIGDFDGNGVSDILWFSPFEEAAILTLDSLFRPINRIVSARGPTKMRPAPFTASAKSAFSDRKP